MRTRNQTLLAATGVLALLATLAACGGGGGGGSDGDGVASLDTVEASDATDATAAGTTDDAPADLEDAMLAYAECMRDHGIDMPDPDFSGDGGAFRMGVGADGMDPNDEKFKEADEACNDKLGDIGGGPVRRAG